MPDVTLEQGAYLVSLARRSMEHYFASGRMLSDGRKDGIFGEKRGVFVTLSSHPGHELRGCIGYPLPMKGLSEAVSENALHAALEDPRFPALKKEELGNLVVEVSVLTAPEQLNGGTHERYPREIKVGRDGLMIEYGYAHGLLLPQVPIEWNWDEREFLCQLCEKAGLPRNMWLSPSAKVSRFQAEVFCEEKPGGKVIRKRLIKS